MVIINDNFNIFVKFLNPNCLYMKKGVVLISLLFCALALKVKGQVHSIVTHDMPHCIGRTKLAETCIIELSASSNNLNEANIILDGWIESKYFTPQYYNNKKYIRSLSHIKIDRDSKKMKPIQFIYYNSIGDIVYMSEEREYEPFTSQVPRSIGADIVDYSLLDFVLKVTEAK